jgi:hypothetical protein
MKVKKEKSNPLNTHCKWGDGGSIVMQGTWWFFVCAGGERVGSPARAKSLTNKGSNRFVESLPSVDAARPE